jgi:hypothetical protein
MGRLFTSASGVTRLMSATRKLNLLKTAERVTPVKWLMMVNGFAL